MGVLTQIDKMTTGLVRKPTVPKSKGILEEGGVAKRIRAFAYRLGEISDGDNMPVYDRAFIEIVDADNPRALLGEINIEAEDADMHARKIVSALNGKSR